MMRLPGNTLLLLRALPARLPSAAVPPAIQVRLDRPMLVAQLQLLGQPARLTSGSSKYGHLRAGDQPKLACLNDADGCRRFVQLLDEPQRLLLLSELRRTGQPLEPVGFAPHSVLLPDDQELELPGRTGSGDGKANPDRRQTTKDVPNGDGAPPALTLTEHRQIFTYQALPFLGFGFLDNLIMILAGDYIDLTLGVTFGISTMAAAGLGNAISDVAGIGSAWYIENICSRIGIAHPPLSAEQEDSGPVRFTIQLGRVIGIVAGCLLGMCPLLVLPSKKPEPEG